MKKNKLVISFFIITLVYLLMFLLIEIKSEVNLPIKLVINYLPVLVAITFVSWLIRYLRWLWLLHRASYSFPLSEGFLAYLSGFSYTATPGKVGELVRIRYFLPLGVPHHKVISAFVFERMSDLIVVLLFSLFVARYFEVFWVAVIFVVAVLSILLIFIYYPSFLRLVYIYLRRYRSRMILKIVKYLIEGLKGMKLWFTLTDLMVSLFLGALAWGLVTISFMWLLLQLGVTIDNTVAIGIYPLSMLVGAASMIPGGLGSTEASIVALMWGVGVSVGTATLAAVTIRVATLWSAIVCGCSALFILESRLNK